MVYVYAITDSPSPENGGQRGLRDAALRVQPFGSIGVVYSVHDGGAPAATAENVLRHEQVVEGLMALHAVLPARFGTTFANAEKLDATLARHHDPLAAGLARVRGHVELGLRVLWTPTRVPSEEPAGPSGREYMRARLAEEQHRRGEEGRAGRLADELHAPLAALASDSTRRVLARPEMPMSAAYLVPRDRLDAFRREVGRLGAARPDLRLLCTGPWPPYHFVPSAVAAEEKNRA